jgi:hypothetical protein
MVMPVFEADQPRLIVFSHLVILNIKTFTLIAFFCTSYQKITTSNLGIKTTLTVLFGNFTNGLGI